MAYELRKERSADGEIRWLKETYGRAFAMRLKRTSGSCANKPSGPRSLTMWRIWRRVWMICSPGERHPT